MVREPRMDDLDQLLAYIKELVEEKTYIGVDHVPTREEERKWLEKKLEEMKNGETIYWVVEKDGKLIGGIEARKGSMKQKHAVEMGIALLNEARGKGLGRQLMQRTLEEIFKKWPDAKLVWLGVFSKNDPAKALYWKLGFRPVARLPAWNSYSGRYIDEEI